MGKTEMPHYKLKQTLLFGKETSPAELSRYGRTFQEAGWLNDAVDFFTKAGDQEGLGRMRAIVVEEGDVFLFRRVLRATEAVADEREWKEIGDNALRLGKLQFAREAYRLAGDRKAMDKVDRLIEPEADQPPDGALPDGESNGQG